MAVVNYERQVEPEVVSSPFHRGITGPGFFGEPKGKATEEDDEEPRPAKSVPSVTAPVAAPVPTPRTAPVAPPVVTPAPRAAPPQPMPMPIPTPAPIHTPSPSQPTQHRPPISGWTTTPIAPPSARSLGTIFGGSQILDQVAQKDMLPPDTGEYWPSRLDRHKLMAVRLFERDARHQVLWFSGPPLAPGTIPVPERPTHSLEYLQYIAKRKRNEPTEKKAFKRKTEDVAEWPKAEMWWAEGMTEEQINEALKATIRQ